MFHKILFAAALLALPSLALASPWQVYLKAEVGIDVDPQIVASAARTGPPTEPFFVPGALDDVGLGVTNGIWDLGINHVSAIPDGFKGHGITWIHTGLRFDLFTISHGHFQLGGPKR